MKQIRITCRQKVTRFFILILLSSAFHPPSYSPPSTNSFFFHEKGQLRDGKHWSYFLSKSRIYMAGVQYITSPYTLMLYVSLRESTDNSPTVSNVFARPTTYISKLVFIPSLLPFLYFCRSFSPTRILVIHEGLLLLEFSLSFAVCC